MKKKKKNKNKKRDIIIVIIIAVIVAIGIVVSAATHKPLHIRFSDYLEETTLTVDGQAYTLRDLAFYIAYEERLVEEQAKIYSPEDTNKYWGLHSNGAFIKLSARDAAMDMAVHDLIFYGIAKNNGLKLTDADKERLELKQQDFWYDFSDSQQQDLEDLHGDMNRAMERMALAQQQQNLTAADAGRSYEDYDCGGTAYDEIRQAHTYEVNTDVWERLDFGSITLSH